MASGFQRIVTGSKPPVTMRVGAGSCPDVAGRGLPRDRPGLFNRWPDLRGLRLCPMVGQTTLLLRRSVNLHRTDAQHVALRRTAASRDRCRVCLGLSAYAVKALG